MKLDEMLGKVKKFTIYVVEISISGVLAAIVSKEGSPYG